MIDTIPSSPLDLGRALIAGWRREQRLRTELRVAQFRIRMLRADVARLVAETCTTQEAP